VGTAEDIAVGHMVVVHTVVVVAGTVAAVGHMMVVHTVVVNNLVDHTVFDTVAAVVALCIVQAAYSLIVLLVLLCRYGLAGLLLP
jgi:hypothetical protein